MNKSNYPKKNKDDYVFDQVVNGLPRYKHPTKKRTFQDLNGKTFKES